MTAPPALVMVVLAARHGAPGRAYVSSAPSSRLLINFWSRVRRRRLPTDENVLAKSGGVFTTPVLAREYGFADVDGKQQSAFWDEHWAGTWGT